MKIRWKTLLTAVLIPVLTGTLAALISKNAMKNFEKINQPPLSPPQWLFPVAWTILYILMGIASYLVFSSESTVLKKKDALLFYGVQLFFNFMWTIIFFNFRQYLFAFIWLCAMLTLIIITAIKFRKIDKRAFFLLIPYIMWVAFAGYLNFGVYVLN